MEVIETAIPGVLILEPAVHRDVRGFFVETYRREQLERIGLNVDFVQESQSRSTLGTVRGLHFQEAPGQAKLIRVGRGRIFDVAVDIRRDSPAFGKHLDVELDDDAHRQVFLPPGIAHGFAVLSDVADVCYAVSAYYDPTVEHGIAWDDPDLGIRWPVDQAVLSERDTRHPRLRELPERLTRW
jgi:dTDP-4-dehydrorhamnose 3,5-epimerase